MYTIFGIPNCNTVKKALTHLEELGVEFEFVNFKKTAPTKSQIKLWKKAFGDWPVNKRGPTYRKIKDAFETASPEQKIELLLDNTSAIKRPILQKEKEVIGLGYEHEVYANLK